MALQGKMCGVSIMLINGYAPVNDQQRETFFRTRPRDDLNAHCGMAAGDFNATIVDQDRSHRTTATQRSQQLQQRLQHLKVVDTLNALHVDTPTRAEHQDYEHHTYVYAMDDGSLPIIVDLTLPGWTLPIKKRGAVWAQGAQLHQEQQRAGRHYLRAVRHFLNEREHGVSIIDLWDTIKAELRWLLLTIKKPARRRQHCSRKHIINKLRKRLRKLQQDEAAAPIAPLERTSTFTDATALDEVTRCFRQLRLSTATPQRRHLLHTLGRVLTEQRRATQERKFARHRGHSSSAIKATYRRISTKRASATIATLTSAPALEGGALADRITDDWRPIMQTPLVSTADVLMTQSADGYVAHDDSLSAALTADEVRRALRRCAYDKATRPDELGNDIGGYADDTALYLQDSNSVASALAVLRDFGEQSGLVVNLDKSVAIPLGPRARLAPKFGIRTIAVDEHTRYLGVQVGIRPSIEHTWQITIRQIQARVALATVTNALQRAAFAQAIIVPKILNIARHCWPPDEVCEQLQRIIRNFVWRPQATAAVRSHGWLAKEVAAARPQDGDIGLPLVTASLQAMLECM
ncbi:TPA: hypothetical protein N0F65_012142 [Lagenidium giganteum]|uniref:Reverse transcriptase domain-containing protein n=1 Tax=Lagenidium giganteum TaxID=4803 RepID=A0AAV2YMM5_9STRA|nr:TPA: hypothetical protein N0F65_012142 [Lagenidium giganteum]